MQHYLRKLITYDSQNHLKYVRLYARFLYEQDRDIALADKFTREYAEAEGNHADHWTAFLQAHSSARHGNFEKGIEIFDTWKSEYSKPANFKDDYWHYKFYLDFMLFYKKSSGRAIVYAKMFEDSNPNEEHKQQLAELYYLNGETSKSVEKLNEVKAMTDDPKKKAEIDESIKKYSVGK